uniref:Putative secreted protein n=1 Tax=Anopheles triannulatus TaxID=58253 RepID=A0A2M4B6V8_9DIPT
MMLMKLFLVLLYAPDPRLGSTCMTSGPRPGLEGTHTRTEMRKKCDVTPSGRPCEDSIHPTLHGRRKLAGNFAPGKL